MRLTWSLALFVLAACSTPKPPECKFDGDCASGQVCRSGTCVAEPKCPDTPCASGEKCLATKCYPTSCGNTVCGASQACVNGACTDDACAGKSCPSGQRCVAGACFVPETDLIATVQFDGQLRLWRGSACVAAMPLT